MVDISPLFSLTVSHERFIPALALSPIFSCGENPYLGCFICTSNQILSQVQVDPWKAVRRDTHQHSRLPWRIAIGRRLCQEFGSSLPVASSSLSLSVLLPSLLSWLLLSLLFAVVVVGCCWRSSTFSDTNVDKTTWRYLHIYTYIYI